MFSHTDLKQILKKDISVEKAEAQIELFRNGFPPIDLDRPATVGDGIVKIDLENAEKYLDLHTEYAQQGWFHKFVPASGAASRMFKQLQALRQSKMETVDDLKRAAEKGHKTAEFGLEFIENLSRFAFYDLLKDSLAETGLKIDKLTDASHFKPIIECLLDETHLGFANLPKGLIPFHKYGDHPATPFEEHLKEAVDYTQDYIGQASVHFTVPQNAQSKIEEHIQGVIARWDNKDVQLDVSYSIQKPSTDTIAVDMDNEPFRNPDGSILFRPGGHGALIENLNEIEADVAIIKNIDNVVHQRLYQDVIKYKKLLAGYFVFLQAQSFEYLKKLKGHFVTQAELLQIKTFAKEKLMLNAPSEWETLSIERQIVNLAGLLDQPMRVCGMVKNEGEPGGGPFWVRQSDGTKSLQIVESSQVNLKDKEQNRIWNSSTHFNPVDLVCGLTDYKGDKFNLMNYVDPNTGFISKKSKDGKDLKALELPGLWNGAMANWITVFVEVPVSVFNPVKTVNDLLREAHQANDRMTAHGTLFSR